MADTILKLNKDEDFYVVWSSIVEAPIAWGTKEELLAMSDLGLGLTPEKRFQRADETSSSALWTTYTWDEDTSYIFKQRGTIRRSKLKELLAVLEDIPDDGDDYKNPRVLALLTPFED